MYCVNKLFYLNPSLVHLSEMDLPKSKVIAKINHLIFLGSPNLQRNGINVRRFFGHCIKGSDETVPVSYSTAMPPSGGDDHDDNTLGKDYFMDFIIRPGRLRLLEIEIEIVLVI